MKTSLSLLLLVAGLSVNAQEVHFVPADHQALAVAGKKIGDLVPITPEIEKTLDVWGAPPGQRYIYLAITKCFCASTPTDPAWLQAISLQADFTGNDKVTISTDQLTREKKKSAVAVILSTDKPIRSIRTKAFAAE